VPHSFAVGVAQPLAIFAKAGAREWAVVQGIRFKLLYGFTGRYGDIVLHLAISLKIGFLAHHRGDFAELALDS
jgi:hypothetical protein